MLGNALLEGASIVGVAIDGWTGSERTEVEEKASEVVFDVTVLDRAAFVVVDGFVVSVLAGTEFVVVTGFVDNVLGCTELVATSTNAAGLVEIMVEIMLDAATVVVAAAGNPHWTLCANGIACPAIV